MQRWKIQKENMFGKERVFWKDSVKHLSAETCCAQTTRPQSIVGRGVFSTSAQDPAIGTSAALIPQLVAILVKSFGISLS